MRIFGRPATARIFWNWRRTLRSSSGLPVLLVNTKSHLFTHFVPAFIEMMTALHSNGTKLVLVEKLDRLARDLMIQETIIGDLRKNGFDLVSVSEPDLPKDDH